MYAQPFRRAVCSSLLTSSLLVGPALAEPAAEPLTLARTLALVLERSPELAGVAAAVRAREARVVGAGLLPNPELRTDVENVGGGGGEDAEQTETTVRVTQLLELAGKRGKRRRVAGLEKDLAGWDYEARKIDVVAGATKAFVRALAAQERVALALELEQLARRMVDAAGARVAAGAASAVEVGRARVTLGRTGLERARAARDLESAKAVLAATWGDHDLGFPRLEGELARLERLPALDELAAGVERAPALARWTTELAERRASVVLAEAGRIPDVTVGAGGRHFSDNGDEALVFELSLPLPVFDRNQAAVAEARHRLDQARAEQAAGAVARRAELAAAYGAFAAAHEQATRLRDDVIPEARRAYEGAVRAYRQGQFGSLDVLDAQRTLFDLRVEHLGALETFHVQAAEIARLTGGPVPADEEDRR
jgi:cobalt-zinc-cadmium efflux system outer membrane protein